MLCAMDAPLSLDRATTTPLDPRVREAMLPWLASGASIPSAFGARGRAARAALASARAAVARLFGAPPAEIVFTASATEANNLAIKGVAAAAPRPGRLIAAATEHHSILHPLRTLERAGHRVELLPVDRDGTVDPADLERALSGGAILVSIAHASAEIGTLQPIADLGRIARRAGVPLHSDASVSLGLVPWRGEDAPDLGTATAHLMQGPAGAAALRLREGVRLRPLVEGGLQEGGLRAGTEALAAIVGFGRAAELALDEAEARGAAAEAAAQEFRGRLAALLPGAVATGHPGRRVPGHVSLCLPGVEAEAVLQGLEEEGVEAGSGSACTTEAGKPSHVLLALGIDPLLARGAVTCAFGPGHGRDDAGRAALALARVVLRLQSLSPLPTA